MTPADGLGSTSPGADPFPATIKDAGTRPRAAGRSDPAGQRRTSTYQNPAVPGRGRSAFGPKDAGGQKKARANLQPGARPKRPGHAPACSTRAAPNSRMLRANQCTQLFYRGP